MLRRHLRMGFYGGAYVFPGGRVETADADPDAASWCDGIEEAVGRLRDAARIEAVAFHLAGIRELFEEAGVLIARGWSPGGDAADLRRAVHRGTLTLRQALEPRRVRPALDRLLPFAHWITPEGEPQRFDTRFFLAVLDGAASAGAGHDEQESVASAWMTAREALARFEHRELVLAPPTWRTLRDFSGCADVPQMVALAGAARRQPVRPRFVGADLLVLPGDPLYDPASGEEPMSPPRRFRRDGDRWQPVW